MSLLADDRTADRERQSEGVEVGMLQGDGVAVEPLVDLGFEGPPEELVEMLGHDGDEDEQGRGQDPPENPAGKARIRGRRRRPDRLSWIFPFFSPKHLHDVVDTPCGAPA